MPVSRLTRYGKVSKYVETAEILGEDYQRWSSESSHPRVFTSSAESDSHGSGGHRGADPSP